MILSIYLCGFLFAATIIGFLRQQLQQNQCLPPGPVGIPILGYLPFLNVFQLGESFSKLGEKFGDVFSLRVGTELAVVLNSYDAIKKAF